MHESDPRKGLFEALDGYESDEPAPEALHNPPENGLESPAAQTIVQMRIYDVLMALLTKIDLETAEEIYDAHERGFIMTEPPTFTGFLTEPDDFGPTGE